MSSSESEFVASMSKPQFPPFFSHISDLIIVMQLNNQFCYEVEIHLWTAE